MEKPVRVAINGFGRIGRLVCRKILYDNEKQGNIDLAVVNDLENPEMLVHLLQYDTTHGALQKISRPGITIGNNFMHSYYED
ncbi:MAG: glyceraldehyde 3-phosphate dehydrogenase N-terminal domain-containing protein, partial [bacterium]|nr:glyceraldehyde 3-phosphate dehydrogenase N-terminal domain-containing protein [bacterium]